MATEDEIALFRGRPVERLIFGTEDEARVAGIVARFAETELGSGVSRTLFKRTSVGVVVGLVLDDQRRVVVKAHQPRQHLDVLQTVYETQRHLADLGFPCPRPVIPPAPIAAAFATVEEFVDEGCFADPHDPAIREAMATGLARLIELTRPLGVPSSLSDSWSLWSDDELWPYVAHSPLFDLEATAVGAEWIDKLAGEAKSLVPPDGGQLLVHSDWSGKHFRFDEHGEITVVYDWDSLGLRTEIQALGIAAGTFTSNFEMDLFYAPVPHELTAFVDAYSRARQTPLNKNEVLAAHAAATYVIAYTARCEHALGEAGDFSEALARFGPSYLGQANSPAG